MNGKQIGGIVLSIGSTILLGVAGYLLFIFPKTLRRWADEGMDLTTLQKLMVMASQICSNYWYIIFPALAIGGLLTGFSIFGQDNDHK